MRRELRPFVDEFMQILTDEDCRSQFKRFIELRLRILESGFAWKTVVDEVNQLINEPEGGECPDDPTKQF